MIVASAYCYNNSLYLFFNINFDFGLNRKFLGNITTSTKKCPLLRRLLNNEKMTTLDVLCDKKCDLLVHCDIKMVQSDKIVVNDAS